MDKQNKIAKFIDSLKSEKEEALEISVLSVAGSVNSSVNAEYCRNANLKLCSNSTNNKGCVNYEAFCADSFNPSGCMNGMQLPTTPTNMGGVQEC